MSGMGGVVMTLVAILLPVAIVTLIRFRNRARLLPLASLLDGGSGDCRGFLRLRLEGHRAGREAAFVASPGSKHSPPRLHVRISYGVPGSFRIVREDRGARIAKTLHLQRDVEVADPELDTKYVFSCEDPTSFALWVRRPEVRATVAGLMDRTGGESIALRNGVLEAIQARPRAIDFSPEAARVTLESVEQLGGTLT